MLNYGVNEKFNNISSMIGNTPLLEIIYKYKGKQRRVFAKAEAYNLSGSIKDRVAFHILKKAYDQGSISPSDVIAEATSGNTGIAFSAMGSYLGHKVVIYMPNWMSKERINLMKSYGAEVVLVSREEGGFLGSIKMTEELYAKGGVFLPGQFSNIDNVETHELYTGVEIEKQLGKLGLKADGVVAGVGTGGTIMGLANYLRRVNPNCKAFPLEPLNSPTLSTGYKVGKHRIQGISDEFIPSILKLDELDDVVSVNDEDAIIMSRLFAGKLGIGIGISSGANFIGAVMAQNIIGDDSTVVTVFADDNKKYLSTDYSDDFQINDNHFVKDIELVGINSIPAL